MLITIGASSIQYPQDNIGILKTISEGAGALDSDGCEPGFPSSDPNGFLDVGNKDLAVADTPGLGRTPDRVDRPLDQVIPDHDLDFDLGQKVHDVFSAAIEFGVPLLPSETFGFGDGDALQSDLLKCLFHLVELEWLDDGFDFFH